MSRINQKDLLTLFLFPFPFLFHIRRVAEHWCTNSVSPRTLVEMALEDDMLLPAREMHVGKDADTFRTRNPNHAVSILLSINYI